MNSLTALQAIIEHVPVGMTIVSQETGDILYANAEAVVIMGRPQHTIQVDYLLSLAQLIATDGRELTVEETATSRARQSGQKERATLGMKYATHTDWFEVVSKPMMLPDGRQVVITSFMNINEVIEAQQSRGALAELQDNAIANLSHEIRTPLNLILGYTDLMESGAIPAEKVGHVLGIVRKSAKEIQWMAETLLWTGKLESGSQIEKEQVDVTAVCQYRLDSMQILAERNQVTLVAGALPEGTAVGHEILLSLAIGNLVGNAIKFSQGGQVTVSLEVGEGEAVIVVADTGIGMKAEHLGIIFDKFRQIDGSNKRKYRGTGIGLHFVKLVVGWHNGRIEVESEPGKGSTFRVYLPLLEGA